MIDFYEHNILKVDMNNEKNAQHGILGWFEGRVHKYPLHIFYEDTDFSGVVYHANYLRYFERARSSFLNLLGITHANLWDEYQMAFTIRKFAVEYQSPARVDDRLIVHTTYNQIKGARLLVTQSCFRDDTVIITAEVEAACITADGRPRRAPEFIKEKIRPFLQM